jgi:ribA/ribD-fused uncharacterized protein
MKFFIVLIALLFAMLSYAEESVDIPHYQVYPRTPAVDYIGEILDFYSVKELYGEFSNFALFPITINGVVWPTSEHYYQAQKFLDPALQELVRSQPTPYLAAKTARDPQLPMREDWDVVKDAAMLIALKAKFSQYKVLQDLLRLTKKAHLYEHTKNDCYWADCGDRTGKNRLGEVLMQIRFELSEVAESTVHE